MPPELAPFWRARIGRALDWFVATDAARRPGIAASAVEAWGSWSFAPPSGVPFEVFAKADRIDVDAEGRATVIDYKTGIPPTQRAVAAGYAPQLPLEGAILRHGSYNFV